jgi:hypothetical protein
MERVKIDEKRRMITGIERWPNGSRTGAIAEQYEMIFSKKWDRIEGGYRRERFEDGSVQTFLFGSGTG